MLVIKPDNKDFHLTGTYYITVIPDPKDDQLPGHALIPELSTIEYAENKNDKKVLMYKLATLASNEIVFTPEIQ